MSYSKMATLFVHLLNRYLLSTSDVFILNAENARVNKQVKLSALKELTFWGKTENKPLFETHSMASSVSQRLGFRGLPCQVPFPGRFGWVCILPMLSRKIWKAKRSANVVGWRQRAVTRTSEPGHCATAGHCCSVFTSGWQQPVAESLVISTAMLLESWWQPP